MLYVPAAQFVHALAPLAALANLPATQIVQADDPAAFEKLPATQSRHLSAAVLPDVKAVYLPTAQSVHTVAAAAAEFAPAVENLPGPQSMH